MDLIKVVNEAFATKKEFPAFKSGDTITVAYRIKEGKLLQIHLIRLWNCLGLYHIGADLSRSVTPSDAIFSPVLPCKREKPFCAFSAKNTPANAPKRETIALPSKITSYFPLGTDAAPRWDAARFAAILPVSSGLKSGQL